MSAVIFWLFSFWTALLTGSVLAVIALDVWIVHRREAMREEQKS